MGFPFSPNTKYTDFYDQARFKLVWNISFIFALLMVVLVTLSLTNNNYEPISYLVTLALSTGSLVALFVSRKYEIVSRIISISGLVVVSYTFLGLNNVLNYTTPLWMVIDVLFAYFTCGRRWGGTILGFNMVIVSLYFYLKFQDNLEGIPLFTDRDMHLYVIEYSVIGIILGYFLHMFVTTNYYAESKVKVVNERLNTHNALISKQNAEKDVMLKEIHHRVKNNLQVITSLLRLQSYEIEDDKSRTHFKEAIDRIKAMALIHEKMYQKEMLYNFDFESYVKSLSIELLAAYSTEKNVDFSISSNVTNIGSRTIVPLALLLNELISNSIKHAFDNSNEPRIIINLTNEGNNDFKMIYSDNGQWKGNSSTSFGQELINSMTEQLEGSIKLEKDDNGTSYTFVLMNIMERFDEQSNLHLE